MNIQTEQIADYHIAELEMPPPPVDTWGENWYPDIDAWCEETFGATDIWGENPVSGWKRITNKYFFTDQAKLDWFITRWS